MPMPVESLNKDSPMQSVRDAISKSMELCMHEKKEGKSEDMMKECAGMIYGMARERTGKELREGSQIWLGEFRDCHYLTQKGMENLLRKPTRN